jgi:hypothetical protein
MMYSYRENIGRQMAVELFTLLRTKPEYIELKSKIVNKSQLFLAILRDTSRVVDNKNEPSKQIDSV